MPVGVGARDRLEAADGPPEQQLRAYVDYLRDMGIYDLYRRDDPKVMLPEGLRERLAGYAACGCCECAAVSAASVPAEARPPVKAA